MTAQYFATFHAIAEILLLMIAFGFCCLLVFVYMFIGEYRNCKSVKQSYYNVINGKMYE